MTGKETKYVFNSPGADFGYNLGDSVTLEFARKYPWAVVEHNEKSTSPATWLRSRSLAT